MNKIGKYEVSRKLGEGATSTVWLARDTFANRDVAVKVVARDAMQDSENANLMHRVFLTEASLAGKLVHPHIVQIYDAVSDDNVTYIVMEFVSGGTLQRFSRPDNLLSLGDVIEVIYKCTRALDFASQLGVIHRDIKPANVLVNDDNDIKITDFGSAALLLDNRTVIAGIGTPGYMSPEQHLNKPINHQTDIYALGVMMFQMLTGRLPFKADNIAALAHQVLNTDPPAPSTLRADIPPEIDAIVLQAMNRDPAKRYATWIHFANDLADVAQDAEALPKHGVLETEKFNRLRHASFFASFADAELWDVLRFSQWVNASQDEVLMKEGDVGDFFYVLLDGEAKVSRRGRLLSKLSSGECFGEMAYLGGGKSRMADVVTTTNSSLVKIPVASLDNATEVCRLNFDRAFLRVLVERLNAANTRLAAI